MYTPQPVDLNDVQLPEGMKDLIEQLAEHNHDTWAEQRIKDGWTYGPARNDALKHHPCLVPYDDLPEGEKEYDRNTSVGTIKLMVALGYTLSKK